MTDNKVEAKPTAWKLEGEAFEKVKTAREAYAAARKQADTIVKEAHKALWDTIHQAAPEIDPDAKLSLDVEYESTGIYMVKVKLNPLESLLDILGKDMKATDEAA